MCFISSANNCSNLIRELGRCSHNMVRMTETFVFNTLLGYPEEYLARFPLEKGADVAVRMALNCLLSRDIYHIMPHYPDPAHRTTALFHQAAYVFVLLFYVPHILQSDAPVMQRIVERFFADRWVLGWAASQVVDLGYEWERYRSAKAALKNSIGPGKNKSQQMYWDRVSRLVVEMGRYAAHLLYV